MGREQQEETKLKTKLMKEARGQRLNTRAARNSYRYYASKKYHPAYVQKIITA
jgi:hypothetical protein